MPLKKARNPLEGGAAKRKMSVSAETKSMKKARMGTTTSLGLEASSVIESIDDNLQPPSSVEAPSKIPHVVVYGKPPVRSRLEASTNRIPNQSSSVAADIVSSNMLTEVLFDNYMASGPYQSSGWTCVNRKTSQPQLEASHYFTRSPQSNQSSKTADHEGCQTRIRGVRLHGEGACRHRQWKGGQIQEVSGQRNHSLDGAPQCQTYHLTCRCV